MIRTTTSADRQEIDTLLRAAFPEEDLIALVNALAGHGVMEFVALDGEAIIGHAMLTRCEVDGAPVGLFGPMGVMPSHQRSGIGSALMTSCLDAARDSGMAAVVVLGDPAYYQRFGFVREDRVLPTHAIPAEWAEAWRGIRFSETDPKGRLDAPKPWDDASLWS